MMSRPTAKSVEQNGELTADELAAVSGGGWNLNKASPKFEASFGGGGSGAGKIRFNEFLISKTTD